MKKAAPLLATCALLLSLSSAAQYGTPNCKDSCTVTVNLAAGCGSGIRVAPDPITVPRSNTTTITWNIVPADPNGWKFHESKGILIQGLDSYAKGRFKPNASGNPHSFVIEHQNKGPAAFKYDVNLVKGTETCTLDPIILDW
jgi:hypothetical protein